MSLFVASALDPAMVDGARLNAERAADRDVLINLRRNGDCASVVRSIDLRFIGSKARVFELSTSSPDLGFTVIQTVQMSDGNVAIDLSMLSDTQPSSIDRLTMAALKIEKRFDLDYDGWGTVAEIC